MPKDRTSALSHADVKLCLSSSVRTYCWAVALVTVSVNPSDPLLKRVWVGGQTHVEGDVCLLEVAPNITGVVHDENPALGGPGADRLLAVFLRLACEVLVCPAGASVSESRCQLRRKRATTAEHHGFRP